MSVDFSEKIHEMVKNCDTLSSVKKVEAFQAI